MTFEDALAYVGSLEGRGWKLGLERMEAFCAAIRQSLPCSHEPRFLHVAGTNGKGSVTAFLQSMLVEHGVRTGAFFSPYVVDPRERVQFGRDLIPKEAFASLVDRLRAPAEAMALTPYGGVTEFEFKTAVGFQFWRETQCDWVALEVGLGGRLDATNVITPAASGIVSIGWDHMHILGDTLGKIAGEKAGIIKPGVPVVVGAMDEEPREVIHRIAAERQAPVIQYGRDLFSNRGADGVCVRTPHSEIVLRPSLFGEVQTHNVAVAVAMLEASGFELDPAAVKRGAETASVPGRFQELTFEGVSMILDGAHNLDSAAVLRRHLGERLGDRLGESPRCVLLTGMLAGHEPEPFYRHLADAVEEAHCIPIDYFRTRTPEEVCQAVSAVGVKAHSHPHLLDGLEEALARATQMNLPVLVTGSYYLVGEILRRISSPGK
jgi:dihydrofolate synthase/folylpolyglutamate synthase